MNTFLIAALTLDGYIGRDAQHTSTKWTSKEDAQFFQKMTKQAGVMIVGRTTFETIGRALPGRLMVVMTRSLQSGQTSLTELTKNGFNLADTKSGAGEVVFTDQSPEQLLRTLQELGIEEVAICGGASVYEQFLAAELVDKMFITIEPVLFGSGIRLTNQTMFSDKKLQLVQLHQLSSQTVVLEYQL